MPNSWRGPLLTAGLIVTALVLVALCVPLSINDRFALANGAVQPISGDNNWTDIVWLTPLVESAIWNRSVLDGASSMEVVAASPGSVSYYRIYVALRAATVETAAPTTAGPTVAPTAGPTVTPTAAPTQTPTTAAPTVAPTKAPTAPTHGPTPAPTGETACGDCPYWQYCDSGSQQCTAITCADNATCPRWPCILPLCDNGACAQGDAVVCPYGSCDPQDGCPEAPTTAAPTGAPTPAPTAAPTATPTTAQSPTAAPPHAPTTAPTAAPTANATTCSQPLGPPYIRLLRLRAPNVTFVPLAIPPVTTTVDNNGFTIVVFDLSPPLLGDLYKFQWWSDCPIAALAPALFDPAVVGLASLPPLNVSSLLLIKAL